MRIDTGRHRLRALGARPAHEQRVLRLWSQALRQDSGRRKTEDFLRAGLSALEAELAGLARLRSARRGEDGSERLLVELADGQTVESVLLPRDGLCGSSQVGCAVGQTQAVGGPGCRGRLRPVAGQGPSRIDFGAADRSLAGLAACSVMRGR